MAPIPASDWSKLLPEAADSQHRVELQLNHPTSVGFFDESGAISSDRIFTVGLVKVVDHPALLKEVKALRKRHNYWDEFKWAGITAANAAVYHGLVDLLLGSDTRFSCFVADRHVADPVARFGGTFQAYEKLATQLLIGSVRPYELMSVLADNYSAPNHRSFETVVRKECNERLRRLAVISVVQVDSGATEGLQLVDVLTGAVGFGFRAECGLSSHTTLKGQVAAHLRTLVGVPNFNAGYTGDGFSVRIYEHTAWLKRQQQQLGSGVQASPPSTPGTVARRTRKRTRGGPSSTKPSSAT